LAGKHGITLTVVDLPPGLVVCGTQIEPFQTAQRLYPDIFIFAPGAGFCGKQAARFKAVGILFRFSFFIIVVAT
jgi:hypothetical protein